MRARLLAGPFLLCGLAAALGQDYSDLPYPGDAVSSAYVTLRGSLAFAGKDGGVSVPGTPPTDLRGAHDIGGGASVAFGMTLPLGFRVEAEGLFHRLPQTSFALGGVTAPASGFRDVIAPMGNLIWDLPVGDFPIHPFIGGGGGMAYTHASLRDQPGGNIYLTNSDWHFAWQAMAGVTIPVAPGARVSAMYRYLRTNGINGKCGTSGFTPALACRGDNADQSVDIGLELDLP